MEKTLTVSAIKNGTVIDHIPAGQALRIIRLLQLTQHDNTVSVGLHLSSRSMGMKDLIKIENRFLTEKEAHDIAVFAPEATISLIRNYQIENKMKAKLPSIVEKILICPNTFCITHSEPVYSVFFVREFKHRIYLHCKYCEKNFERDEVKDPYT